MTPEFQAFNKILELAQSVSKNRAHENALLNLLRLEIGTNLSLLDKITSPTAKKKLDDGDENLPDKIEFFRALIPILKVDTLIAFVATTGEGHGLRKRIRKLNSDADVEEITIRIIRKHKTMAALMTLPAKLMTKTNFLARLNNLKKDQLQLLGYLKNIRRRRWYEIF